jgi:TonB-dependent receptor
VIRRALGCIVLSILAYSAPVSAQTDDADAPYGEDEDEEVKPGARGTISGRIIDKQSGQPLADTTIDVVGTEYRTVTDSDGKYRLELPPGNYTIRIWTPGYQPIRAQNVIVVGGGARKVDVGLEPEASVVEEYVVEERPDSAGVDALAIERQRSAAVGDSLGRAEMSKTPDRNAAQAARRVVGVSIVGNRFVYVRGLGERYTNALLNGAPLPSPEPDRAAVPLDLFPTLVLENMTIAKTFTPDVPGDFAGGSVRIETRQIPSKPLFQVSLNGGYNSQATFRDRLSHRGSPTDWLGFDGGTRDFPSQIPDDEHATEGQSDEVIAARGNAINSFMSATRSSTPPNFGANVIAGDSWELGGERKLGAVAAIGYGRSFNIRKGTRRVLDPDVNEPSGLTALVDGEEERGIDTVSWGAYGSLSYELNKNHRLSLIGLHSQLSDKTTTSFQGFYKDVNSQVNSTRLEYVTRTLDYLQLSGEHHFPDFERAQLDWFASVARAERTEPDTRNTVYTLNTETDPANPFWAYYDSSQSGQHFWADQYENSVGSGLSWTQPVTPEGAPETRVKFGGLVNLRTRNFEARRLALRRNRPADDQTVFVCRQAQFSQSCIDDLFVPQNIGPNLLLEESTVPQDAYDAELDVYAGFLMADVSLADDLRLIVGQRVEITHQTIDPYNQFDPNDKPDGAALDSTDLLPALAVVYSLTPKTKTRFALTRTLARPQLRELAPFAYSDYFAGRRISGNPDLDLTTIVNADLRFEHFPTLSEVLAFSIFYKNFKDPIEPVIVPSGSAGLVTFQNAEGANLIGVELEARKNLAWLSDALTDFSVITNLTLARSRIQVRQTDINQITNLSRAMVHQAPYVFNLALDWTSEELKTSLRVSYNFIGPRIVQIGTEGLDDVYEQERHTFDVVATKEFGEHIQLKLSGQNLTNSPIVQTQGPDEDENLVLLRYTEGTIYTLTAAYTY